MSRKADPKSAEMMARLWNQMAAAAPDGLGMVLVLIATSEDDTEFNATLVANLQADVFAPVLRRWLERYDAGDDEDDEETLQ